MVLRCEFHVPISPTPDFLRRIWFLAESIRRNSGLREGEYRIVVTLGDDNWVDVDALCPWAKRYPIQWRWVSKEDFGRWWYAATAYLRFSHPFESETVVMLDGDVIVTGRLDELIDSVRGTNRLAAVPGYFSPFYLYREHLDTASPTAWWQRICNAAGVPTPPFNTEHPGWPWMQEQQPKYVDEFQFCPPYPNLGVVAASAETAQRIGERLLDDFDLVNTMSRTALSGQVAITLSIARLSLQWTPLPVRYNFPNIPWFHDGYQEEATDIRVLHYQHEQEVHRTRDFANEAAEEEMLARTGLHAVNQYLVERLRELDISRR